MKLRHELYQSLDRQRRVYERCVVWSVTYEDFRVAQNFARRVFLCDLLCEACLRHVDTERVQQTQSLGEAAWRAAKAGDVEETERLLSLLSEALGESGSEEATDGDGVS